MKSGWLIGLCFFAISLILSPKSLSATNHPRSGTGYPHPIAAVYFGPGACREGCASAAANIARNLGFLIRRVGPANLTAETLADVRVWIQPGGDAIRVARALSSEQKRLLRSFVASGGGYIGLCAGAFFADEKVDDALTIDGLNLLPGVTHDKSPLDKEAMILPIRWEGATRHIYFQDGPTFELRAKANTEVLGRYEDDNAPAILRFRFGLGKVVLSGVHPEAPEAWIRAAGLRDPDGPDGDIADQLFSWFLDTKN